MILDGYREIEDEEAAINLFYMWHPPKFASILSHWHERMELLYVLEGSLDVLCGDLSATVRGGEVVVINPNQLHAASSGEDGVKYYASGRSCGARRSSAPLSATSRSCRSCRT